MPASVKGGIELRKALRKFTPDLAKETQQKISGALKPIVKSAKGYLPDDSSVLSGWLPRQNSQGNFPTYTGRLVKAGIGYKTTPGKPNRRGFRSLASVLIKLQLVQSMKLWDVKLLAVALFRIRQASTAKP